jgi:hypothetical protein
MRQSVSPVILVMCVAFPFTTTGAMAFGFSDNFSPASSLWSNSSGSWTSSGGTYYAQQPNNNPEALTLLPFVFTNVDTEVTVTVNNLGDGGLLFEAPSKTDYVINVLGGAGYGNGDRGGSAGASAYWANYSNPNADYNINTNAFTPGNTYTVTVKVVSGVFSLYIDGSSTASTSYDYPGLTSFEVGLYDNQPNTTSGSGFGPAQTFSNFSVTGTTAVPEPTTWAMMLLGFAGLGFSGYRASRKRLSVAA